VTADTAAVARRPEITRAPATATAVGLAAGGLSALLGIGGGLIMVPAMVYLLRVRQQRAHGTSLAVIMPAALAAVYRYHQAGLVSGLLGVGGGIVMVPAIVFLLGREQHVAQGVSLAVIIPVSVSGAFIHYRKGNLIPSLALWLSVGAVIGATVVGAVVQRFS